MDEDLPEFSGMTLVDVNQQGIFEDYPLHVACIRGLMEEAEALLAGGAEVNSIGEMDDRPIHSALTHEHLDVAALLLRHGADLNVVNRFGQTPLSIAKSKQNSEFLRLIENAS